MNKLMKISVIVIGIVVLFRSISFCVDKKTDKLRELYKIYNSTSTPKIYKQILMKHIIRYEGYSVLKSSDIFYKLNDFLSSSTIKTMDSSLMHQADPSFKLGEVYCYPNPAKKINPIFHIETGIADKVELKIYDVSGSQIFEATLNGMPQVIDDGQGPEYAYEYLWDVNNIGSGVYIFSVVSKKGDKTLKRTGRCAVIK